MLTVGVKDFGPIREGSVILRPLTIFVGPNNSGKSYLASLVYALSAPLTHLGIATFQRLGRLVSAASETPPNEEVKAWLSDQTRRGSTLHFAELPDGVREYIDRAVSKFIQELGGVFDQSIQRCFGSTLANLVRKRSRNGLRLSITQSKPLLNIELQLKAGELQVTSWKYDFSDQEFDLAQFAQVFDLAERIDASAPIVNVLLSVFVAPISSSLFRRAYYFPAARSGVLQSHTVLASVVLSKWPLVGIEEIPRLSGVVADFISNLLNLSSLVRRENRDRPDDISRVASFLEAEIGKGKIDMTGVQTKVEYPEIYYESDDGRFLMHQVSSTVAEIAPVVLLLKHLVRKGDLLIIEEPEAHLHPDNQRILARAIVKLTRLGIHVLITTHSDYFVQQISNFILLSQAPDEERLQLGYSKDDYLRADDVGAYLFHFDKKGRGSLIKELEVTHEDGIPEDQFLQITEAICNETAHLQRPRISA